MLTMVLSLFVVLFALSANAALEPCDTVGELKGDEENSNNFYQCTNSGWQQLSCPANLVFNENISVCDWPNPSTDDENDNDGDDNDSTDSSNSNLDPCESVGELKPDPENSQNFYQCTNSGWQQLQCPANLVFNAKISVCDWPSAPCDPVDQLKADPEDCHKFYQCTTYGWQSMPCPSTLVFNEDTSICDWPKPGTKCGGNSTSAPCDPVDQLKADPEDCHKFYQCTTYGWQSMPCPSTLVFNEDTSICDWPKPGTKCGGNSTSAPCDPVDQLKADPEDCHKFYQCTTYGWQSMPCPSTLVFNEDTSICDWPKPGTKCGGNSTSAPCDPVDQLKADPEDCHKFYQCTTYGWQSMPCPSTLVFNEDTSICDWPKPGTKCGGNSTSAPCDPVDQLKADPEDCHKFYQCTTYGWQSMPCPSTLVFNEDTSICDWPKPGTKCGGNSTSDCDTVGEFKADTDNCQNYYQCTTSGWEQLSCPAGLFFNTDIDVCDYPKPGTTCEKDDDNDDDDNNWNLLPCKIIGQKKADTKHCELFYLCTSCGWTLEPCKVGYLFNPKTLTCDVADQVTCAKDDDLEPCDVIGELKPDYVHCDLYYNCSACGWRLLECATDLLFNPKTSTCDLAANVTCAKHSDDDHTKLEPCDTIGQLKPNSDNCAQYYKCTKKGWGALTCASGLLFNPKTLACENADQVNCGDDDDDDDNNNDVTTADPLGPCEVGALKPDPKNCNKFYQCAPYGWQIMPCYTGLFFNPVTQQCDYPDNVDCKNE